MKPLGQITVICGSMFAGKSEELIRLVRRATYARKKVQVFKHALDDRFAHHAVATHTGVQLEAVPVHNARDLLCKLDDDTEVIAIEEAQFFDEELVQLCVELADAGKTVIVAGLDQDFRRQPFGIMPHLMAVADEVIKLRAICVRCGRLASHTQRLVDGRPAAWDEPTILIGASEHYEARCRNCHQVRRVPSAFRKRLLGRRRGKKVKP
ncbi:MAG: thymidine kinase [Armatimonadota bacterium]|nr:thymidine kinase [Armatimonadota bacterium]